MNETIERPDHVTEEHLIFLDELRESGKTNMFGSGAYVEKEFGTSRKETSQIVGYWMDTFSIRHPEDK